MFHIDTATGLLLPSEQVPSPNCDARPVDVHAELIVVHCISLPPGEYEGRWVDDFFQNRLDPNGHAYFQEIHNLQVSAHVLIGRSGRVCQYVPFHQRAWHAGESEYQGRKACNDFSIGIELEGTDETPFRTIQYWKLAQLIQTLQQSYPALENCPVVGHSDIAPQRKTDPGTEFDWQRLQRLLQVLSDNIAYG